jgi:Mg2+ and Co2+ transporter CorA
MVKKMSWFAIIFLCLTAFIIGLNSMGTALHPEQFPWKWLEFFGWVFFAAAVICWDIARR